jgi:hypothetical protein
MIRALKSGEKIKDGKILSGDLDEVAKLTTKRSEKSEK